MKGFVVTAALGLFIGAQALPATTPIARGNGIIRRSPPELLHNVDVADAAKGEDPAAAVVDAEQDPAAALVDAEEDPAAEDLAAEADANAQEVQAEFDAAVAVEGDDVLQDVLFAEVATGQFKLGFQNDEADEITVTNNAVPNGVAPAGFEFIEQSSFTVAFAASQGLDLTLSTVNFIFDAAAAELEGKDIAQAQVGKLCAEVGAFVVAESLGEVAFDAAANEVSLNLNQNVTAEGEFAFFVPVIVAAEDLALADQAALDAAAEAEKEKKEKKEKPKGPKAKEEAKAEELAAAEHEQVDVVADPAAVEHEVVEDVKEDPAAAEKDAKAEDVEEDAAKVHPPPKAPHHKQRDDGDHSH